MTHAADPDATCDRDERVDPSLAHALLSAATEHLGTAPGWAKVGFSEFRSDSSYSVTCAATAGTVLVIAEMRVRSGAPDHIVVQAVPRSAITQVASYRGRTYAVLATVTDPSVAQEAGFRIEGPLLSLPDHTPAHRVLAS